MHFPALQLIWSPTGAGAVVHGHALPLGGVEPVPETGLTFGFEGNVRLRYPPPHEAREICRVENKHGALRLFHYHPTRHYCWVNGRDVAQSEQSLRHRDVIAFMKGPIFRVLEAEVVEARSLSLEAAIRAAPNDREVLHVYGDFLLDRGDPLGERLARARSEAFDDDGRWLDALAVHYEAGLLGVDWEQGLAVKAVLRNALGTFPTLQQALEHLARLPVMRFLRELTVDVSSDNLSVADGLQALAGVTLPETVTKVSLGDVPVGLRERVAPLLARARRPVHVGYYDEALLEMVNVKGDAPFKTGDKVQVGTRIELGRSEATSHLYNIILGGSHLVVREGPRFVLSLIDPKAEYAKVNGRMVDRFPLRDGDVIELPGELVARFTLVR